MRRLKSIRVALHVDSWMVLRDRDQDNTFGDVATEGFYVFGQFGQFVGTMVEVEQSVRINSLRSSFSVSSWNRQTTNLSCMLKNITTIYFIICYNMLYAMYYYSY